MDITRHEKASRALSGKCLFRPQQAANLYRPPRCNAFVSFTR